MDADRLRQANPWHPISDPVDLKHLGKLGEELNECGAALSRCIRLDRARMAARAERKILHLQQWHDLA